MSGLREMVKRELSRRADANAGRYAPERLIVHADDPDREAKIAAIGARYPGKIVIVRTLLDSALRLAPRPEIMPDRARAITDQV